MPHKTHSNNEAGQSGGGGDFLADVPEFSLDDLCRACGLTVTQIHAYVEEGIVDPEGREPAQWRFTQMSLVTLRRAGRLERDLRLNAAGVALALELMDEIEHLKRRLARFEQAERAGNLTKD